MKQVTVIFSNVREQSGDHFQRNSENVFYREANGNPPDQSQIQIPPITPSLRHAK